MARTPALLPLLPPLLLLLGARAGTAAAGRVCHADYALDVDRGHVAAAAAAVTRRCANHTALGAECLEACRAYALAEAFPACGEGGEGARRPCKALCSRYAAACAVPPASAGCDGLAAAGCTEGPAPAMAGERRALSARDASAWDPRAVESYRAHAASCGAGVRAKLYYAGVPYEMCPTATGVDCGTVAEAPASSPTKCGTWLRSLTTLRGGLWESIWRVPLSQTVLLAFLNNDVGDPTKRASVLPNGTAVCVFDRVYHLPLRVRERLSAKDLLAEQGLAQLVVNSPKYEGSVLDALRTIIKRFSYSVFLPHETTATCAEDSAPGARADKAITRATPQLVPARDPTYAEADGLQWLSFTASWPGGRMAHYPIQGCDQFGALAGVPNSNVTCGAPPFRTMLAGGKSRAFRYDLYLTSSLARSGQATLTTPSDDDEGIALTLEADMAPGATMATNASGSATVVAGSNGHATTRVVLPRLVKGGGVEGLELTVGSKRYVIAIHYRPPMRSLPYGAFCQRDAECISGACDVKAHACAAGAFGVPCSGGFMCDSTRCDSADSLVVQAIARRNRMLLADGEAAEVDHEASANAGMSPADAYKLAYARRRRWLQTSGVPASITDAARAAVDALGYNGTCGPAPIGFACTAHEQCLSSRCDAGRCIAASLASPCSSDADCMSLRCNASAVCDRAPLNGVCDFSLGGKDCITDNCVDVTYEQSGGLGGGSSEIAFACGPAEIGRRCESDAECLSGNCGNAIVRRCEAGAYAAFCVAHIECQSLNCDLANRMCDRVPFEGRCAKDSDCTSANCGDDGRCGKAKRNGPCLSDLDCLSNADGSKRARCILAAQGAGVCGASPYGLSCDQDAGCVTGNCQGGTCVAGRFGSTCEAAEECLSGTCGDNGRCAPSGLGLECSSDSGCLSGFCDFEQEGGSACALALFGMPCTDDAQCLSTVCGAATNTCGPGPTGVPCVSGEACQSGLCSEATLTCATKPYNSRCSEDTECRSMNCDLARGVEANFPSGMGLCGFSLPGRPCKEDQECSTEVCVNGYGTPLTIDANVTTAPPMSTCEEAGCMGLCDQRQRFGSECTSDADCLSANCDPMRKTCAQSAPGYPCRRFSDCATDLCLSDGLCALRKSGDPCFASLECASEACEFPAGFDEFNATDAGVFGTCAPPA